MRRRADRLGGDENHRADFYAGRKALYSTFKDPFVFTPASTRARATKLFTWTRMPVKGG